MKYQNEKAMHVASKRIECDERWSYVYAKDKNVPKEYQGKAGDVWTWVAIDADSKLIVSWMLGDRNLASAKAFMVDLHSRLIHKVQLTTDGFRAYPQAVEVFDEYVDYAVVNKLYGHRALYALYKQKKITEDKYLYRYKHKYSPDQCCGVVKEIVCGNPNPKLISTSYIERQNLTMRMHMRRFTRLTNGFSKKIENHMYAIALHFVYYNFCKVHKTLKTTPAVAAGLMQEPWTIKNIIELIDANQGTAQKLSF